MHKTRVWKRPAKWEKLNDFNGLQETLDTHAMMWHYNGEATANPALAINSD